MPLISRRRDPFWDVDGAEARRRRRRSGLLAVLAFATAFVAVVAAVIAWAAVFGLAPVGIPTIALPGVAGDFGSRPGALTTGLASVLLFATVLTTAIVAARVLRHGH